MTPLRKRMIDEIEMGRLDIGQSVAEKDQAMLAVEAGRTIFLDQEIVIDCADRNGLVIVAIARLKENAER